MLGPHSPHYVQAEAAAARARDRRAARSGSIRDGVAAVTRTTASPARGRASRFGWRRWRRRCGAAVAGGDGALVEVMRQRRLQLPLVVAQLPLGDVRFEPRDVLQLFDELLLLACLGAHIDWRFLRRSRRFHR